MNVLLPLYIKATSSLHSRAESLAERRDRGSLSVEWVGIVVLVTGIIWAIWQLDIANGLKDVTKEKLEAIGIKVKGK